MDEKLLKIIEHYGVNAQQRKLQEEVFELQEAITLFEYGKGFRWGVIEELADVFVLLNQIGTYYHIEEEEIINVFNKKVDRTLKRIEKEKKDTYEE